MQECTRMPTLNLIALEGVAEVEAGDDLAAIVLQALDRHRLALQPGDVIVLAQKIVSKSEGRSVALSASSLRRARSNWRRSRARTRAWSS